MFDLDRMKREQMARVFALHNGTVGHADVYPATETALVEAFGEIARLRDLIAALHGVAHELRQAIMHPGERTP